MISFRKRSWFCCDTNAQMKVGSCNTSVAASCGVLFANIHCISAPWTSSSTSWVTLITDVMRACCHCNMSLYARDWDAELSRIAEMFWRKESAWIRFASASIRLLLSPPIRAISLPRVRSTVSISRSKVSRLFCSWVRAIVLFSKPLFCASVLIFAICAFWRSRSRAIWLSARLWI